MNKTTFIVFCIEYYSYHIKVPSSEVYTIFKKEELLSLLENNYEALYEMSMEYMMQFFDEYLRGTKVRHGKNRI